VRTQEERTVLRKEASTTTNKRLQRMKVHSRKTFKFRKTRKREKR
jgi:hypothetical protein